MTEIIESNRPEGRPLKFESVELLQSKINEYFASCFEKQWKMEPVRNKNGSPKMTAKGKPVHKWIQIDVQVKPVSITGLAVFLDTSRETLINYEKRDEFFDTIKRAKDICHNFVEDGMLTGQIPAAAAIFNLKNNFSWEDKTEHEVNLNPIKAMAERVDWETKQKNIKKEDGKKPEQHTDNVQKLPQGNA